MVTVCFWGHVAAKNLRRKLGDDADSLTYILTEIRPKLGTEKWSKTRGRGEVDAAWALLGGGIHGQISGNEGEDTLDIAHRDRSGDHPDLTAARIKVGGRPDACVCGQWRRDPSPRFDVVGRHGEVEGGIACGWSGLGPE